MKTYSENIMSAVRQNMYLEPDDTSHDAEIMEMPEREVLNRWFVWQGIIGYTDDVLEVVSEIYDIELE